MYEKLLYSDPNERYQVILRGKDSMVLDHEYVLKLKIEHEDCLI